jgi:hypothetical protein
VLRFPYNRLHAMCDCQASGGGAMLEKTETTVPIISVPSANQSGVLMIASGGSVRICSGLESRPLSVLSRDSNISRLASMRQSLKRL